MEAALASALEGLARVELYLYGFFGLVGLACGWAIYRAGRRLEDTPFGIERAEAEQKRAQAGVALAILLLLSAGLFWSTRYGAQALSGSLQPTAAPTVVLTPTPITGAGAVSVDRSGCNPNLQISQPADGALVNTTYEILGTANTPNLAFYKLEISGSATNGNWVTIHVGIKAVENGSLNASFSPNPYTPGNYALRLTTVDNDGQASPPCVVSIQLDRPGQPTPPPVP
ncbi:MAG: hypothetical protein JNL73_06225 [Anaerolineales bacterium]|nr:hypothetical protein [Anaerolineales bacterium]